jgi:hypothetical protein
MYYKFITKIELKEESETQLVNQSIRQVLKEFRVDNIETLDNIVRFRNSNISGKFRSNINYMTIISKGILTVINEDNKTKIIYESYAPFLGYLIFFLIFIVVGILVDLEIFFVFSFILFLAIFFSYLTIKNGSLALLKKVKERLE